MKKTMLTMLCIGIIMLPALGPAAFGTEPIDMLERGESLESEWEQALRTQVALARAKVVLLKAQAELQLDKNHKAALLYFEEAQDNLSGAYQTADKVTRKRIAALEKQLQKTKSQLEKGSEQAFSEINDSVQKSRRALNAATAEAHDKEASLNKQASTHIALAKAHAEVLKAKIAIDIEDSRDKANKALERAKEHLIAAKSKASDETAKAISKLDHQIQDTQKALDDDAKNLKTKIDTLATQTEEQLKAYGHQSKNIEEKEIAKLKKQYCELEAQVAIQKAQLAASRKGGQEKAHAYLEEARTWYQRTRNHVGETGQKDLGKMEEYIEESKDALKKNTKQAQTKLSDLLRKAAERVKPKKEE